MFKQKKMRWRRQPIKKKVYTLWKWLRRRTSGTRSGGETYDVTQRRCPFCLCVLKDGDGNTGNRFTMECCGHCVHKTCMEKWKVPREVEIGEHVALDDGAQYILYRPIIMGGTCPFCRTTLGFLDSVRRQKKKESETPAE
jgi:hypothetical protein